MKSRCLNKFKIFWHIWEWLCSQNNAEHFPNHTSTPDAYEDQAELDLFHYLTKSKHYTYSLYQ